MQARPPRKTDFTHTPDQVWHIAAENQRTVKRLMNISHRRSEWVGVHESKVIQDPEAPFGSACARVDAALSAHAQSMGLHVLVSLPARVYSYIHT